MLRVLTEAFGASGDSKELSKQVVSTFLKDMREASHTALTTSLSAGINHEMGTGKQARGRAGQRKVGEGGKEDDLECMKERERERDQLIDSPGRHDHGREGWEDRQERYKGWAQH